MKKNVIYISIAFLLLFCGYLIGIFVQHQREIRLFATFELYRQTSLYRELSLGKYDLILKKCESNINHGLELYEYRTQIKDLPGLIRWRAFDNFQAQWHEEAIAVVVGLHHARPDVSFSDSARKQLESFSPLYPSSLKVVKDYSTIEEP